MTLKIKKILKWIEREIVPDFILDKINPEARSIKQFIELSSRKITPGERVLDTGAGSCPYKKYFSHTNYESTDFKPTIHKDNKQVKHTFYCSLDKIPRPDKSYDAIINTQVLEHVEYPQKVINEFFRILNPGGRLFLTAPQSAAIHEAPNNFFSFTKYGLSSLFKNAGFEIVSIEHRGGIFWHLSENIKDLPKYISDQHPLLKPIYFLSIPFTRYLIPFLFFYLDRLDIKKDFTSGYACYCIKH